MTSKPHSEPSWGSQYRLVASERWKAKSAAMGQAVTDALVEYSRPEAGMRVLDLASAQKIAFGASVVLASGRK